ncbi:MAG: hypothetical protein AB1689_15675 [Thermodesulfobacteriota bacterium]
MRRRCALLALLVLLPACTSARGLDRDALAAVVAPPAGPAGVAPLARPFKLGIFLHPPAQPAATPAAAPRLWEWEPSDEQKLLRIGESLKRDRIVSDVVLVGRDTAAAQDLASIRRAAAREGADAVLVVSGVVDVDRYNNWLGPSYVLLLTPLLIPGTVVDALFVSHAGLWGVRDELLYSSVEADGAATQTRPAWMVSEQRVVALAKERSVSDLAAATLDSIERLAE